MRLSRPDLRQKQGRCGYVFCGGMEMNVDVLFLHKTFAIAYKISYIEIREVCIDDH